MYNLCFLSVCLLCFVPSVREHRGDFYEEKRAEVLVDIYLVGSGESKGTNAQLRVAIIG